MIGRMTISMEVIFKNAVMNDQSIFVNELMKRGFELFSSDSSTFMLGKYTVRGARMPRIKNKAINLGAISISAGEIEDFIKHIAIIKEVLLSMNIDPEKEFSKCAIIINSWVKGEKDPFNVLSAIHDISGIDALSGFVCHRTPFDKLEFVSQSKDGILDYSEWEKIDIDSTPTEYIVTLHYYADKFDKAERYLLSVPDKLTTLIECIEHSR